MKESNVTNSYEDSDHEYDDYDAELLKTAAGSSEDTANYMLDTAETTAIIGTGENSY